MAVAVFSAGVELSAQMVMLARDGGPLYVGVCVVQCVYTDVGLFLPQLTVGRVQLLLNLLKNKNVYVLLWFTKT